MVLSIDPDALALDDSRHLVVPVVASLPVVFVDDVGSREDPSKNLYGQTIRLRRLLAPQSNGEEGLQPLVRIRHVSADEVAEDLLRDARLVVLAGVERPGPIVPILREYVVQGGQLVIAAGGAFDPVAWTEEAWLDGGGILPASLTPAPVGVLPESGVGELDPFFLDLDSLTHDYFRLETESPEALRDVFQEPLFFQAIVPEVSEEMIRGLVDAELARVLEADADSDNVPRWLEWSNASRWSLRALDAERRAARTVPRVLAKYSNGVPFLVEREIFAGRVLLFTTGVFSDWSTLTRSHAVFLFDRVFRRLLESTFQELNHETGDLVQIPVSAADRRAVFALTRPGEEEQPIALDAHGDESYSIALRDVYQRGHYRVVARRADASASLDGTRELWTLPVAIDGPARESDLEQVAPEELSERVGDAKIRWVSREESLNVEGALIAGAGLWKLFMASLLVLLLVELGLLASRRAIVEGRGAVAVTANPEGGAR